MLLTLCNVKGRNGLCDLYKNIINNMTCRDKIVALVPEAYKTEEFHQDFAMLFNDEYSKKNNLFSKVKQIILTALKIKEIVIRFKIKKIFIFFDNALINLFLFYFLRKFEIEYSLWIHDPQLHDGENKQAYFIRFLISKLVFPKIDNIFVAYSEGANLLASEYNIPVENINVIKFPGMMDLEFNDLRYEERKLTEYEYDLLFFGRIEKYKGIEILIEALEILIQKHINIKLLIIGKGQDEELIKLKILDNKNVTFINEYMPNRKLAEYLINCRWVILPYTNATGSLHVQIANYYNKPVLATKVGCFKEDIKDGINGFFIEDISSIGISQAIQGLNQAKFCNVKKQIEDYFEENFKIYTTIKKIEDIIHER